MQNHVVTEEILGDSVTKVCHFLDKNHISYDLRHLTESTRTAQMAADVLGCSVAEIASSLIFQDENEELVLIITSGGHRVDLEKIKAQTGRTLIKATGKKIKEQVGYAIGGIPPVAHKNPIPTYFDKSLLQFATVWAAAGSPFAVLGIDAANLQQLSNSTVLDVAEKA